MYGPLGAVLNAVHADVDTQLLSILYEDHIAAVAKSGGHFWQSVHFSTSLRILKGDMPDNSPSTAPRGQSTRHQKRDKKSVGEENREKYNGDQYTAMKKRVVLYRGFRSSN